MERSISTRLNRLHIFNLIYFSSLLIYNNSGSRRKLSTLAIYTEEDSKIDMSDLETAAADTNDLSDKEINVSKKFFFFTFFSLK